MIIMKSLNTCFRGAGIPSGEATFALFLQRILLSSKNASALKETNSLHMGLGFWKANKVTNIASLLKWQKINHVYPVTMFVCLCWGITAQSTQWGHVKCGQFT